MLSRQWRQEICHPGGAAIVYTDGQSGEKLDTLHLAVDATGREETRLALFPLGVTDTGPTNLETDLVWLGGDLTTECWQGGETVRCGESDDIAWSCNDQLLMMSTGWDNPDDADLSGPTREAYLRMVRFARESGYPWLLRLWNFVPRINQGNGDGERYRRFCLGRQQALEDMGITNNELCAATAVGTRGDRLLIHILAARAPGIAVENPRQVSAYHYPRLYGPRSPSFARATAVKLDSGGYGLFVSGTASIVGHRTIHPDQLMPQVDETICNLQTLLEEAAKRVGRIGLARFDSNTVLRVYLRDADRWHEVEQRVRNEWPGIRLVGMEADICRSNLMVEMEAFHHG